MNFFWGEETSNLFHYEYEFEYISLEDYHFPQTPLFISTFEQHCAQPISNFLPINEYIFLEYTHGDINTM